jgi:hypothetical protein
VEEAVGWLLQRGCLFVIMCQGLGQGQLVRLATVFFSHIKSAPATNHLPISSIFLSQQISTNH